MAGHPDDNREIVEARFVTLTDAPSFAMARPFRDYLARKASEAGDATAS